MRRNSHPDPIPVILLSPKGRLLTQQVAGELAQHPDIVLLCGHYEGVDQRIVDHLATDELSIGDYILTGGELAAMVVIDCVARFMPEVLGSEESTARESHTDGLLQYPQYTRPPEFRGWSVPEILLSGHHARIDSWRKEQSLLETQRRRPDLLTTTGKHFHSGVLIPVMQVSMRPLHNQCRRGWGRSC